MRDNVYNEKVQGEIRIGKHRMIAMYYYRLLNLLGREGTVSIRTRASKNSFYNLRKMGWHCRRNNNLEGD
jgi:hypothetical protein